MASKATLRTTMVKNMVADHHAALEVAAAQRKAAEDAYFAKFSEEEIAKLTTVALHLQKAFRGKYVRLLTDEVRDAHLKMQISQYQKWQEDNSNVSFVRIPSRFSRGRKFVSKLRIPHSKLPCPVILIIGDAMTMSEANKLKMRDYFLHGILGCVFQ